MNGGKRVISNRLGIAAAALVASIVVFHGKALASTGLRTLVGRARINGSGKVLEVNGLSPSLDSFVQHIQQAAGPNKESEEVNSHDLQLKPSENGAQDTNDPLKPKRKSLLSSYILHVQRKLSAAEEQEEADIAIETDFMSLCK